MLHLNEHAEVLYDVFFLRSTPKGLVIGNSIGNLGRRNGKGVI